MNLVRSPLAAERTVEPAHYVAQDKPGAAERWLLAFFTRVEQLESLPQSGRVVPELAQPALRELDFRSYRVIDRVEPARISILTVRHSRRLLDPGRAGRHLLANT